MSPSWHVSCTNINLYSSTYIIQDKQCQVLLQGYFVQVIKYNFIHLSPLKQAPKNTASLQSLSQIFIPFLEPRLFRLIYCRVMYKFSNAHQYLLTLFIYYLLLPVDYSYLLIITTQRLSLFTNYHYLLTIYYIQRNHLFLRPPLAFTGGFWPRS